MLKPMIKKLIAHQSLNHFECEAALNEILNESTNPLQIAAFLVLLRAKRESATELTSFVNFLRCKMTTVPTTERTLDIVGTGGDGHNTINISTASAMLAASCGIKIAKHGNRSVSSLSGSADVLGALGINIHLSNERIAKSITDIGIGFCYSPNFHPSMQQLRTLRQSLNIATTFNILGPLLNPANAAHLILGVYDETLLPTMAEVLKRTGTKRSMVVHGGGLDEISCIGPLKMLEVTSDSIFEFVLDPHDLGLKHCSIDDLRGGNAAMNAAMIKETFQGKKGPIADTLALNAAIALYLYGLHATIQEGLSHAQYHLANGNALTLLNNWIDFSHAK